MVPPELEFNKYLGKGSYGSVSLFKYSKPRTTLYTAVKTCNYKNAESLEKEFGILSEFKGCSRIVQCYENRVIENLDVEGNKEYMMLMEYAAGGSLRTFMKRSEDKKLPDPLIREFTRMILEGLATIHGQGYVHCDLKPDNILVFPRCVYKKRAWRSSYELKISDFGLSKRDGDSKWWHPHRPFVGTAIYMSPGSVSHGETGRGLDLWSLGCVVLEMYTGKKPWWHNNYDLKDLKNWYAPMIPSDLPCDAKHFIMACFALNSNERRDALTLLEHSFLRGVVNKITKPHVKNENPKEIALALGRVVRRPSKVLTSIFKRAGELMKIIKKQPRAPRSNLLPVHICHLAQPSQKICFFIYCSLCVVFIILTVVCMFR
ncbi:Protein kinase domain [Arabidopsis suecica]|uniref:Protein kinase domain n=1 Tax=Arabidopsis suecica TaxID=45249 RepID=A0A8T2G7L9_ARASU|nr:Protein kinase domain [Arabidopsis suecica]